MSTTYHYLRVFVQLMRRDVHAFKKQMSAFAINYMIVCPVVYSLNYGYLMPNSGMVNPTPEAGTLFFAGSVLQVLISPSIGLALGVFFDMQHTRLIQYQLTFAPLRLIIFERILFFSAVTFFFVWPYYFIAKWLLGGYLATVDAHWLMIICILYLGALFFAAFTLFFVFLIERIQQFGNFFNRLVYPMIQLGGLRIPFSVFLEYSVLLGIIVMLNPLMHLTEGLRKAMLGGTTFLPYFISIGGVLISSLVCALLAMRYAYKRLDAV